MNIIDFKKKRENLNEEILNAIAALMLESGRREVHLDVGGKPTQVLRYLNLINQYEMVRVKRVKYDGKKLYYKAACPENGNKEEDKWWSLEESAAYTYSVELYERIYDILLKKQ